MKHSQAEIDMARRHVLDAQARIDAQVTLITRIREHGQSTAHAEELLRTMLGLLDALHAHLRDVTRPK